ncbi:MAG TPA: nucleotidyltransferase family protein [Gammaproteobacteria bacterium]|nr:nucleotidyltransferase family protein [Gammaproteobacteria bacterium]HIO76775.1 nucleotidyltransferase family protein [Gammaproteobacteria bacterium]
MAEGMSSSIKSGIRALPADLDAVVLCLGDMPLVVSAHLDLLINNFSADVACAPYCRGRRGHPVQFPRSMFPDLLQLSGDTGARELLEKIESTILQIDVNDEGIFFNVNRPADL